MSDTLRQVEFYRQLGERIREHRIRRKLSQGALAKLVGLTRTSLTNIESGRQRPPLYTLCEIVEHLKVDLPDLLPPIQLAAKPVDLEALVGSQLRDQSELAFIKSGLGFKKGEVHGHTKAEDSTDDRGASC